MRLIEFASFLEIDFDIKQYVTKNENLNNNNLRSYIASTFHKNARDWPQTDFLLNVA